MWSHACRLPLLFLHTQLYFSGQASTLTASMMARSTWQPYSLQHTFSMLLHGELSAMGLQQFFLHPVRPRPQPKAAPLLGTGFICCV